MANPDPEITPEEASAMTPSLLQAEAITPTVNNVLGFPISSAAP